MFTLSFVPTRLTGSQQSSAQKECMLLSKGMRQQNTLQSDDSDAERSIIMLLGCVFDGGEWESHGQEVEQQQQKK